MAISSLDSSSSTIKQGPPRRLAELLEEKQEPFVLEIYLLERGFRRKVLELDGKNKTPIPYMKKLPTVREINPPNKMPTQFLTVARNLYNKMVSANRGLKSKKGSHKKKGRRKVKENTVSAARCSSVSCSTLSWSEIDTNEEISMSSHVRNEIINESTTGRMMSHWRFIVENKQCSPNSVLDEIDLLQAIPVYSVRQVQEAPTTSRTRIQTKVSDDSILSATLWEMLVKSRKEKTKKLGNKCSPKYMNSKKVMQQTQKLLFDCVREVVENQNNGNKHAIRREKGLMGSEEIGKIICTNLKAWRKLSADETNICKLLRMDVLGSKDEFSDCEVWKREIVMEIGNGIFEDITDEIVRDMIHIMLSNIGSCTLAAEFNSATNSHRMG